MGHSISWLAVKTDDPERLYEMVGAIPTAEPDEWLESDLSGSPMQDGWYLFQAQGYDHPMNSDDSLARISALGETVACSVEEHVMARSAECW